ncbi:uncharacterized protein LOC127753362 [Oryza glaberrima]|uniref:Bifunctional inhibitor/plant lipid transfer protein/seed storage helical domain-containing protein n=1 Tax=Oryza glaberrima TaxID=4538 RepID=I1QT58_ORYGL|nr:uncharacterized protein LOC127753362 [Oryza glaberrima]
MEHIRSFLLAALAVVVAAATAAAAGLPPLPSTMPADVPQPEIPPCLNDLMPCASVYDDSSMLGPCCDALGKVFKSDRACLCQIWEMARNDTRQVGSNALDGDQQMFARCKIPGASSTICDNGQAGHGTSAGDSSTGSQARNASPHSRLTEAFRIFLLLQILFILGV